ncbi:MAG: hypothetical protein ABEH35_03890 [Haloarculaceae archaeon]
MFEYAWVLAYLLLLVVPAGSLLLCYWVVDYVGDEELVEMYMNGEYPPGGHARGGPPSEDSDYPVGRERLDGRDRRGWR